MNLISCLEKRDEEESGERPSSVEVSCVADKQPHGVGGFLRKSEARSIREGSARKGIKRRK